MSYHLSDNVKDIYTVKKGNEIIFEKKDIKYVEEKMGWNYARVRKCLKRSGLIDGYAITKEKRRKLYTVYNKNDDTIVCFELPKEKVCEVLGIRMKSFYPWLWHVKRGETKFEVFAQWEEEIERE